MITGREYNERLKEAFLEAWYDESTIPNSTMFDPLSNEASLKTWQGFNAEIMVALRWAFALGGTYTTVTEGSDEDMFAVVPEKVLYSCYPINRDLVLKTIFIRVSKTKVILYALDVVTGSVGCGVLDLSEKTIRTGTGRPGIINAVGNYYETMLLKYLSIRKD